VFGAGVLCNKSHMDPLQRTYFLAAIAEAAKLIRLSQTALQRAHMHCDGEVADHVNLMCTRIHELRGQAEQIQQAVLGTLEAMDPQDRRGG